MKESRFEFNFEKLEVYQKAMEFGEIADKLVEKFPKKEMFRLTHQFTRAADSMALNIAEGSGYRDLNFKKHLRVARGSCLECVSASTKASLRNYISKDENEINRMYLSEINKMISGLLNYLENKYERK